MNDSNPAPSPGLPAVAPSPDQFSDPKLRQKLRDELRAEEWAMHKELMAAGRLVLNNFYENPHKSSIADLSRILDLADKFGRMATESGPELEAPQDGTVLVLQFQAALKTVYARRHAEGKPLPPGAVIDVQTTGNAQEGERPGKTHTTGGAA